MFVFAGPPFLLKVSSRRMRAQTGHRAERKPEAAEGEEQEARAEHGTEHRKAETNKLANEAPEGAKWSQNCSLEASGRPLGADLAPGGSPEGSWRGSGAARGCQQKSLLVAWGPPGAKSWSISGLRGVPGRPPEGAEEAPGGDFRRIFCNRALRR